MMGSNVEKVAGEGAVLVDPYSIENITEGIEKVLQSEELRNDITAKGFRNVEQFTWNRIAQKYYELYSHVARANAV